MGYTLPADFLRDIAAIPDGFWRKKQESPDNLGWLPGFLGGTNGKRPAQTQALAQMLFFLFPEFVSGQTTPLARLASIEEEQLSVNVLSPEKRRQVQAEKWLTMVAKLQTMVAFCLYIQSSLPRGSSLSQMIDKALGISPNNRIADPIKALCFATAMRVTSTGAFTLEQLNAQLPSQLGTFSPIEWQAFNRFLNKEDAEFRLNHALPIATTLAAIGGTVGSTLGVLGAGAAQAVSSRVLAATIGGYLAVFYPTVAGPAAFFVPVAAEQLASAVCNLSLGYLLSIIMGILGTGAGFFAGLTLDTTRFITAGAQDAIAKYFDNSMNGLIGIDLETGAIMRNGRPIFSFRVPKAQELVLEHTPDGILCLNGEEVKQGTSLTTEVVEALSIFFRTEEERDKTEQKQQALMPYEINHSYS